MKRCTPLQNCPRGLAGMQWETASVLQSSCQLDKSHSFSSRVILDFRLAGEWVSRSCGWEIGKKMEDGKLLQVQSWIEVQLWLGSISQLLILISFSSKALSGSCCHWRGVKSCQQWPSNSFTCHSKVYVSMCRRQWSWQVLDPCIHVHSFYTFRFHQQSFTNSSSFPNLRYQAWSSKLHSGHGKHNH